IALPVATFLTDFGIHPLWVSDQVGLHIAVHPEPARQAAEASGREAAAPGPLVSPRFSDGHADRETARARLGLNAEDRAVLTVAGSWGVGGVARTFKLLAKSGKYVPIAVCG